MAHVSLGASKFVFSKSFLAYLFVYLWPLPRLSVSDSLSFYTTHFVYFACLIVWFLIIHPSFCMKQKAVWKEHYIGLFQKEAGGLRTYIFEKNPGIFHFFYFTPGNSTQILHPWKFQKFLLDPLEIKAKNQDPWKFHIIFSSSPLEIPPHF